MIFGTVGLFGYQDDSLINSHIARSGKKCHIDRPIGIGESTDNPRECIVNGLLGIQEQVL